MIYVYDDSMNLFTTTIGIMTRPSVDTSPVTRLD